MNKKEFEELEKKMFEIEQEIEEMMIEIDRWLTDYEAKHPEYFYNGNLIEPERHPDYRYDETSDEYIHV